MAPRPEPKNYATEKQSRCSKRSKTLLKKAVEIMMEDLPIFQLVQRPDTRSIACVVSAGDMMEPFLSLAKQRFGETLEISYTAKNRLDPTRGAVCKPGRRSRGFTFTSAHEPLDNGSESSSMPVHTTRSASDSSSMSVQTSQPASESPSMPGHTSPHGPQRQPWMLVDVNQPAPQRQPSIASTCTLGPSSDVQARDDDVDRSNIAERHTQIDMFALKEDTETPPQTAYALDPRPAPAIDTYGGKTEGRVVMRKTTYHLEQAPATATRNARLKRPPSSIADPSRIGVTTGSPWGRYVPVYTIDLAGSVEVALSKVPPIRLVHVRTFAKPAIEKTLRSFERVQHENIVAALEAFTTDDALHVVLEYMPVSLEWIVRSPAYPNEVQLAAILGQVVHGLAYLAALRLQPDVLSCSTILVSMDGDVKIANQDACHLKLGSDTSSPDLKALSLITMELMQKYVQEGGAVGVDNLQRWHSSSDAVGFLSATTSAGTANELL